MKKLFKLTIVALLLVAVSLSSIGCASSAYKTMRKDLEKNGTYNAEYGSYTIELTSKIDYYCYDDSKNIWLSYMDFSGQTFTFFIHFDKKLSGEYDWTMRYDDYSLEGVIVASEVNRNTESLSYDTSKSKDSTSASINKALKELAASTCKLCLTNLEEYFIDSNLDVSLTDLGFDISK